MSRVATAAPNPSVVVTAGGEAVDVRRTDTEFVLRLGPGKKGVKWTEDVVDNEHMGRKSSKRECRSRQAPTTTLGSLLQSFLC